MKLHTLAAAACLVASPALAVDLGVPNGSWAYANNGKASCAVPVIQTAPGQIIEILPEGKGVCAVTSFKGTEGKWKCKWDESVPEGLREREDGDADSFSLKKLRGNRIVYNNMTLYLCENKR